MTLGDKVAILFLEVARRSPWCRGTPAHVHWSLLRCPPDGGDGSGDATVSLRFVSSCLSDKARDDVPLYHDPRSPLPSLYATDSPLCVHDFPTSGNPTTFPFVPAAPSGHRRHGETLPLPLAPFLPLTVHCRHDHYHRLLLWLSSTSNDDDPTHPTVARYYHSVLLAIYRPLSTTLPPNGVYRCCLAAWLRSRSQRSPATIRARFSPPRDALGTACPRKSAPVVYRRRPTENRRTELLPLSRRVVRGSATARRICPMMTFSRLRLSANRYRTTSTSFSRFIFKCEERDLFVWAYLIWDSLHTDKCQSWSCTSWNTCGILWMDYNSIHIITENIHTFSAKVKEKYKLCTIFQRENLWKYSVNLAQLRKDSWNHFIQFLFYFSLYISLLYLKGDTAQKIKFSRKGKNYFFKRKSPINQITLWQT